MLGMWWGSVSKEIHNRRELKKGEAVVSFKKKRVNLVSDIRGCKDRCNSKHNTRFTTTIF